MRRMRHKSSEVSLKTVNTIGVVRADGLHICPVHSTHIIRPDLSYLDQATSDAKSSAAATTDGAAAGSAAADMQPVRLTAVTARGADARRKRDSFAVLQQIDEGDPWVPLVVQTAQVRACALTSGAGPGAQRSVCPCPPAPPSSAAEACERGSAGAHGWPRCCERRCGGPRGPGG